MKQKKLLLLSLILLLGVSSIRAKEAYVLFFPRESSLNFLYDDDKSAWVSAGYTPYSLNTGDNTPSWSALRDKVKAIRFFPSFADYKPTSCHQWAYQMTNLTQIWDIERLNTSNVTDMGMMFCGCRNLVSVDVSGFNTSNVTSMKSMFEDCVKLTSLAVGNWDTSKVTEFQGIFYGCSNVASLDVSKWNTSKATSMRYMFYKCSSLTFLDVRSWNTSLVTTFYYMFSDCSSLKTIYGLNSSSGKNPYFTMSNNVTTVEKMFRNCSSLEQLWLKGFEFSSMTATSEMLKNCTSLKELYISDAMIDYANGDVCMGVGTTSNPCYLSYSKYKHPYFGVVSSEYVVWKNGYFISRNIVPYVTFYNDRLSFFWDDESTLRPGSVYELNTESYLPQWLYHDTEVKSVYFNASFANARPTTCRAWFSGMSNLTSIEGLQNINTTKVTSMRHMFNGCASLKTLDLNRRFFSTDNVTTMEYMFSGCSNLETLDISNFNTANVTDMDHMFYGCSKLSNAKFPTFNTDKVVYMTSMFQNCSSLNNLDVSNFNTEKAVAHMNNMFNGCSKLTSLDLGSFTIYSRTSTQGMLSGCTGLKTLTVPATADYLNEEACTGVGTTSNPCELVYPSGFTPMKQATGSGWYKWKGGYFKEDNKFPLGDVNHDGFITVVDATLVTAYVLGNNPPNFFLENADMNNDNSVTVTDVSKIVSIVLGN